METIQINILNPKAKKLFQDLASLDLISIREASTDDFSTVLAACDRSLMLRPARMKSPEKWKPSDQGDKAANRAPYS